MRDQFPKQGESLVLIKTKTDKKMENSLDHLFGNLMGGLDEIVKEAEAIVEKRKNKTDMKNIFIQSHMDTWSGKNETFLEVGSTESDNAFCSVPTKFSVSSNGTCWVDIKKQNFRKLKSLVLKKLNFEVTEDLIQEALLKQWNATSEKNHVWFTIR